MIDQSLSYPYGPAKISGRLKQRAEDFKVTEELGFSPAGEGEHLFLWVEKTGMTTHELIEQVARDFSIHPKHVSYSGLKDKQAVTRQWLSLHLPGQQQGFKMPQTNRYTVLDFNWHNKKLRIGTHKFNHFEVLLREVIELPEETRRQLQKIDEQGFANYFGEQRFGRQQDNVEQALKQLSRTGLARHKKSLYLSSLRSYLFNQILAERINRGYWQHPLQGDVFMLSGSRSIFSEQLDASLMQRFQSQDISNTASLYGSGQCPLSGVPFEIEDQVFSKNRIMTQCLDRQGAKSQMRALRVAAESFNYRHDQVNKTLMINIRLPSGSYLTSLLEHFIQIKQS